MDTAAARSALGTAVHPRCPVPPHRPSGAARLLTPLGPQTGKVEAAEGVLGGVAA